MNKTYGVVWNACRGVWQVVSERTSSGGQRPGGARVLASVAAASVLVMLPGAAQAAATIVNSRFETYTWDAKTDLSITSSGAIFDAANGVVNSNSSGTIATGGTLTNAGRMLGSTAGLTNTESIATLINQAGGIIGGTGQYGILNHRSRVFRSGLLSSSHVDQYATIGSLANSGTISGSQAGIMLEQGALDALTNAGAIKAGAFGINNEKGTIGQIVNAQTGSIHGDRAIDNSGTLGTLTNRGVITGGVSGVRNSGPLSSLVNDVTGTIGRSDKALSVGVWNEAATIGSLTNAGAINARAVGIVNEKGSIGQIVNARTGTINASQAIVNSSAYIGTLTNQGVISGELFGIVNSGTMPRFVNDGTLQGTTAFFNAANANLGQFTNSGVIAGSIANESKIQLTIAGATGTAFGTLTGVNQDVGVIKSVSNVVFSSGNLLLNDTVTAPALKNLGATLQVNRPMTIQGDYLQTSAATLLLGVWAGATPTGALSDTGYGQLVVKGNTVLAAGTSVQLASTGAPYGFAAGQRFVAVRTSGPSVIYNASNLNYGIVGLNARVAGAEVLDAASGTRNLVLTVQSVSQTPGGNTRGNTGGSTGANTGGNTRGSSGGTISNNRLESYAWDGDTLVVTPMGSTLDVAYGIVASGSQGTLTNAGNILGTVSGLTVNERSTITSVNNQAGAVIGGTAQYGVLLDGTGYGASGIYKNANIDSLANSGTISGTSAGVKVNVGTIGALTNQGTIAGYGADANAYAIHLAETGSKLGTLINSGLIVGPQGRGIGNTGTIGQMINTGTIDASGIAIRNISTSLKNGSLFNATISTLINDISGTIGRSDTTSAGAVGVWNEAVINTLTNAGTIHANAVGIVNEKGGIGQILNARTGTINGSRAIVNGSGTIATANIGAVSNQGVIGGGDYGVVNSGTIQRFVNDGTLLGSKAALYNNVSGTIGQLINSGVIAGTIVNQSTTPFTIGGATGTTFGTLTGLNQSVGVIKSASDVLFSSGNLLLNDTVSAPALRNVSATLQVNQPTRIEGDYTQASGATLLIGVSSGAKPTGAGSDTGYGQLVVAGNAMIDPGSSVKLTSTGAPYGFAAGQRYVAIQAAGPDVNYRASQLNYGIVGMNAQVVGAEVRDATSGTRNLVLTLQSVAQTPGGNTAGNPSDRIASLKVSGAAAVVRDAVSGSQDHELMLVKVPQTRARNTTENPDVNIGGSPRATIASSPSTNPGGTPGANIAGKPGATVGSKMDGNTAGTSGALPCGIPEGNTDGKPSGNTGKITGGNSQGSRDGKPGTDTGKNPGANAEGNPSANPLASTCRNPGGKTADHADGNTDAKAAATAEGKADGKTGATTDGKADGKAGATADGKADGKTGAKTDGKAVADKDGDTDGDSDTGGNAAGKTVDNGDDTAIKTRTPPVQPVPEIPQPARPTTPVAMASLGGLQRYTGVSDLALLNLYNASLALGNTADANRAGARLAPGQHAGASRAAGAIALDTLGVLGVHIDQLRTLSGAGSGMATGDNTPQYGVWGQALGGHASQSMLDSVSGYSANYGGLMIGFDHDLDGRWVAGGAFAFSSAVIKGSDDNSGSTTRVTGYGLLGYASFTGNPWYVTLSAGAVRQRYTGTRLADFPGFKGSANASFMGQQYMARAEFGFPLALGRTTLTPLASLTYSYLMQGSYEETGGNGAALAVGTSDTNSLRSALGLKIQHTFASPYGDIVPFARVQWLHEFVTKRQQVSAVYVADPLGETAFTTVGAPPVANLADIALGVALVRANRLSLSLGYTLQVGGGYLSQSGTIRLRQTF